MLTPEGYRLDMVGERHGAVFALEVDAYKLMMRGFEGVIKLIEYAFNMRISAAHVYGLCKMRIFSARHLLSTAVGMCTVRVFITRISTSCVQLYAVVLRIRVFAVEVDGPSHYHAGTRRPTAATLFKHRQLRHFGVRLVVVPYFEWDARRKEQYAYLEGLLSPPS